MPDALLLLLSAAQIGQIASARPGASQDPVSQALSVSPEALRDAERLLHENQIETNDRALVDLFRRRTPSASDLAALSKKIRQLGADSYRIRTHAAADLARAGEAARPLLLAVVRSAAGDLSGLRPARTEELPLEVVRRAALALRRLDNGNEARLLVAAARLLARDRPADAAAALIAYLPFATDTQVVEEIQEILPLLALRDGQPEEVLLRALADPQPRRRAAAGAALIRAGAMPRVPDARRLLEDSEPNVRLQVARAMLQVRDKSAVPTLIDLLAERGDHAWQAEELLSMIAGEEGPHARAQHSPGENARAWRAWWQNARTSFDLARLDEHNWLQGYTLITQMDAAGAKPARASLGRVYEIRSNGDIAWHIDGLRHPVDAQVVGKDHVLIAEYLDRRVTERDFHGNIIWQKQVHMPITCQRLPNGDTFIATRRQLLIVDSQGAETFAYHTTASGISAARRLRDGKFVIVHSGGLLERLSSDGRVLKSFQVGAVYSLGGNIDALPGEHVLVPQFRDGKVVEYDADGKAVWEARVSLPTSAVRLPNGHVLVVSMLRHQVTELARDGREVWTYRTDGRPWRARRR